MFLCIHWFHLYFLNVPLKFLLSSINFYFTLKLGTVPCRVNNTWFCMLFFPLLVCYMLSTVFHLVVFLQSPVPDNVRAMSPSKDQHNYTRSGMSWEGLTCPWGSSVAVTGSRSKCIHLSVFCYTALTVASSRYLLSGLIKINLREFVSSVGSFPRRS